MKPLLCLLAVLACSPLGVQACTLSTAGGDIQMEPLTPSSLHATDYGQVLITCPENTPWTLEVQNAQPGGVLPLQGASGNTLTSHLTEAQSGLAIGQISRNEGFGGVGTGTTQAVSIRADVSVDRLPVADTYSASAQVVLVF